MIRKRMDSRLVVFLIILIVLVILNTIDFGFDPPGKFSESHLALGRTSFELKGSVSDKYISNSHNRPVVVIKNFDGNIYRFSFQTNDEEFYDYVQMGDSVYSSRYSGKARVWNKNKSKNFNFIE